jgi:hypothetical protein
LSKIWHLQFLINIESSYLLVVALLLPLTVYQESCGIVRLYIFFFAEVCRAVEAGKLDVKLLIKSTI